MNRYKMRAECQVDVGRFLRKVPVLALSAEGSLDMVIDFTSNLTLDEIRKKISKIVDGHVMLETVALYEEYTGFRGTL